MWQRIWNSLYRRGQLVVMYLNLDLFWFSLFPFLSQLSPCFLVRLTVEGVMTGHEKCPSVLISSGGKWYCRYNEFPCSLNHYYSQLPQPSKRKRNKEKENRDRGGEENPMHRKPNRKSPLLPGKPFWKSANNESLRYVFPLTFS